MKIETETSMDQLPKQISSTILEITKRMEDLKEKVAELHPEKIYDSFVKTDDFRRGLYEVDLLSQNLMESYRLYALVAAQALSIQSEEEETDNEES